MNIREMIELTALVSAHSPLLIESGHTPERDPLTRYWGCFKASQRNWINRLAAYPRLAACAEPSARPTIWKQVEPVLIEVFATEIVTRVWGAILTANDRHHGTCDAEPIARNVLIGQMEARQQALQLMVNGPHVSLDQITAIDRLRRLVERWTDLLLGHLVKQYGMGDFAFDIERALDFGEEQLRAGNDPRKNWIWDLYFLCLHAAFLDAFPKVESFELMRRETMGAILASFPPHAFDDNGPLKSVWLGRISRGEIFREGPPELRSLETLFEPRVVNETFPDAHEDQEEGFNDFPSRTNTIFRQGAD